MNNKTYGKDAINHAEPSSNALTNDVIPNYGTIVENNDHGSDDFGYVEFSGKDGRTCPTCNGTGRIAKHQEDELVALIPYNDRRLKPSRTKYYVILAIIICLLACGLTLFFLLPRAVTIREDKIIDFNVSLNKNLSSTTITILNRFNISNTNFFEVQVSSIAVEASFDQVSVGNGDLSKTPITVAARQSQFPVDVKIVTHFNKLNQLEYLVDLCTNPKRKVHDIVVKLQATLTTWYLQHSEQNSINTYKYIDCSANNIDIL